MAHHSIVPTRYGWCGFFALRLEALPAMIPGHVDEAFLHTCASHGASVELCMLSGPEHPGTVEIVLILRVMSAVYEPVPSALEALKDALTGQLRSAGFGIAIPDEQTLSALNIRLGAFPAGSLCFAGEKLRERLPYYVPSGCLGLGPVDVGEITAVLARRPGACFSLMLNHATLLQNELQDVRANMRWLDSRPQDQDVSFAREVYGMFDRCAQAPLHLMSITVRGSNAAVDELAGVFRRHRLSVLPLPDGLVSSAYLAEGAAALADFTAAEAHELNPNSWIGPSLRRLNHMLLPGTLERFMPVPPDTTALHGVSINRLPQDNSGVNGPMADPSGLRIGDHADSGAPVYIPLRTLTQHCAIVGMPGSGKTTGALGMLHSLHARGIPFLAIEPGKTEYRALMDAIPGLRVYTPGRSDVVPCSLNPFLPPKGVTLEQFLPHLTTAFAAAFTMTTPLDVIFPHAVRTCYTRYGWRTHSTRDSEGVKIFGMREFIEVFRGIVRDSEYDSQSKGNLESGGVFRLQSLLTDNPLLYDTDRTLPFEELLEKPTVIELDAIENSDQKSLVMALILINLMQIIKRQVPDGSLRNVIMIDEAHLLLGRPSVSRGENGADPAGQAALMLQDMTALVRAYGTGLIFADQFAEKLTDEIINNTGTKLIFRLESMRDRTMLADSTGMGPEIAAALPALPRGQAYLHCAGLGRTLRVCLPNTRKELKLRPTLPNDEVSKRMGVVPLPPFAACAGCDHCREACDHRVRTEAAFIAQSILDTPAVRAALADSEKRKLFFSASLDAMISASIERLAPGVDSPRLRACVRLHVKRLSR